MKLTTVIPGELLTSHAKPVTTEYLAELGSEKRQKICKDDPTVGAAKGREKTSRGLKEIPGKIDVAHLYELVVKVQHEVKHLHIMLGCKLATRIMLCTK